MREERERWRETTKDGEDKNPDRVSEGIRRQRVTGVNEGQAENKKQTI